MILPKRTTSGRLLLGVLLLMACHQVQTPAKPKNLISKETMVDILIDIRLLSSAMGVNKDVLDNRGLKQSQYIRKKYHVDSLQFTQSNTYYAYHIDAYQEIYAKVKDSLETLSKHYEKLQEKMLEEKRVKDSIRFVENSPHNSLIKEKLDSIKAAKHRDSLSKILRDKKSDSDRRVK